MQKSVQACKKGLIITVILVIIHHKKKVDVYIYDFVKIHRFDFIRHKILVYYSYRNCYCIGWSNRIIILQKQSAKRTFKSTAKSFNATSFHFVPGYLYTTSFAIYSKPKEDFAKPVDYYRLG